MNSSTLSCIQECELFTEDIISVIPKGPSNTNVIRCLIDLWASAHQTGD